MGRIQEGVKGKEEKGEATWDFGCDPIRVRPHSGLEIRVRPHSGATQFGVLHQNPAIQGDGWAVFKRVLKGKRKEEKQHGTSGATPFGCDLFWDWKFGCDLIRCDLIRGLKSGATPFGTPFGSGVSAAKKRLSSKPQ
jgi:hypothetical protein